MTRKETVAPAALNDQESKAAPALDPLDGITPQDCCLGCNVDHCAITHANICGHPHKGGLQPIFQMDPACLERYRQARIRLAEQRKEEIVRELTGARHAV